MKRILALVLSVIFGILPLVGCAGAQKDLTLVRLAEVTHSIFYAPMYAAIYQGFFEEEGIEIELTNAGGADKAMAALLSESCDVAFMGPEASVYVVLEGREDAPKVIGQLTQRDGAFLVSRKDEPDFSWEKLAGSYIIGGREGGMPEMTLEYVLRNAGLDPDTDVTIDTAVAFNLMSGAFVGGTGDYVALFEPTASQVQQEGQGYIVGSIGAASGSVPYTCFQVTKSYFAQNEDLLLGFLRAIQKGVDYVLTHSDAEVAQAVAPAFADTDLGLIEKAVASYRSIDAWAHDPVMHKEDYERLLDIMELAGHLDGRVDFDKVIDNSLAEKIANE